MTIRIGDQTLWLEQNFEGGGRAVLLARGDDGCEQVLLSFYPKHAGVKTNHATVHRNYAFHFASSNGRLLLPSIKEEDSD